MNDSKHPFESRKDRHENIGQGTLGPEPFQAYYARRTPRARAEDSRDTKKVTKGIQQILQTSIYCGVSEHRPRALAFSSPAFLATGPELQPNLYSPTRIGGFHY